MQIINISFISMPQFDDANGELMAVLTSGNPENWGFDKVDSDFAVYIGIVPRLNPQDFPLDGSEENERRWHARREQLANMVAHGGQKLPYYKAVAYFPSLEEEKYRA